MREYVMTLEVIQIRNPESLREVNSISPDDLITIIQNNDGKEEYVRITASNLAISIANKLGVTRTVTLIISVTEMNNNIMVKRRDLTFTDGILTAISNESDWVLGRMS